MSTTVGQLLNLLEEVNQCSHAIRGGIFEMSTDFSAYDDMPYHKLDGEARKAFFQSELGWMADSMAAHPNLRVSFGECSTRVVPNASAPIPIALRRHPVGIHVYGHSRELGGRRKPIDATFAPQASGPARRRSSRSGPRRSAPYRTNASCSVSAQQLFFL